MYDSHLVTLVILPLSRLHQDLRIRAQFYGITHCVPWAPRQRLCRDRAAHVGTGGRTVTSTLVTIAFMPVLVVAEKEIKSARCPTTSASITRDRKYEKTIPEEAEAALRYGRSAVVHGGREAESVAVAAAGVQHRAAQLCRPVPPSWRQGLPPGLGTARHRDTASVSAPRERSDCGSVAPQPEFIRLIGFLGLCFGGACRMARIRPQLLHFTPVDKGMGRATGDDVFVQPSIQQENRSSDEPDTFGVFNLTGPQLPRPPTPAEPELQSFDWDPMSTAALQRTLFGTQNAIDTARHRGNAAAAQIPM
ncbi:hypothetical protein C8J57DRAFT_1485544 [Mycena rebaudengoi]|nr:hypothetical protein C8J57DRAFT_1485544 [Mycena rebaudengoi]